MKAKFLQAALLVGLLALTSCSGGSNKGDYKVRFLNWNESVLYTDYVDLGETAVYEGDTPTKPADDVFSYEFSGWDKDLGFVTESFDTHAQFTPTPLHVDENYDETVKDWSVEGHLYIHYRRAVSDLTDYNDWAIWLWQNAPTDSEGTLWGASNPEVQNLFNEMSTSWMTDIGGSGKDYDQSGRIMDIDLNHPNLVGGKTGQTVNLNKASRLGFLIVKQDTMDGGDHWTSDGGANTYINDFDKILEEQKFVHIYCVQGNVGDFTFSYSNKTDINPVVMDKTGKYRSTYDVDSSTDRFGLNKTSESFKDLGVGYQIFVASFRDSNDDELGDIRGIINALPYLQKLGVEVLWLTPIQESESYHGYDITDFYRVDPKFGTTEDYRELIYTAHKMGMKVLMDFVINHTSKNNIWFKKSQRDERGVDEFGNTFNYRDMYHWKFKGDKVQYFDGKKYVEKPVEEHPDWYKDGESDYYYYGKFGSNMAELNYDCQATRDFVINMALYWMGFGLDGFRLDAVKHIYMKDEVPTTGNDIVITDTGTKTYYDEEKMETVTKEFDFSSDMTKNINFWKEFAARLKGIYPDCFLVGENFDGWGTRIAPYYQALDSQFDFALYYHNFQNLYGASADGAKKLSIDHFKETNERYASTAPTTIKEASTGKSLSIPGGSRPDFINSPFTSNHDTARMMNYMNGRQTGPTDAVPAERVTGTLREYSQARVGAASTILNPGLSWIYYGDELGMTGNTDKHIELYDNENNIDLWYRQPFVWEDEKDVPTYKFDKYTVTWDDHNAKMKSADEQSASPDDNDMFDYFQALIAVKKMYGKGAQFVPVSENQLKNRNDVYEFRVKDTEGGSFHVYINSGAHNKMCEVHGSQVLAYLNGATENGMIPPYGVLVTK